MRYILLSIIPIAALMQAPAIAQQSSTLDQPDCSKANIASIEDKIGRMKDGRQKETAAAELTTAKDLVAKGKGDECKEHLLKASVQTK